MRTVEWTTAFSRDYKRIQTTPRHRDVGTLLAEIGVLLADDQPLKERHRDHALSGNWKDHRECHLKPDLLLIYKKPDVAGDQSSGRKEAATAGIMRVPYWRYGQRQLMLFERPKPMSRWMFKKLMTAGEK